MQHYSSLVRHGGNRELFSMLELSILSQKRGIPLHLHVEGLRGTGKTTIIRASRDILPTIVRIKGCLFNCDPNGPHCPNHRGLTVGQLAALGVEEIPTPFVEISASAKIGTVVGTLDLALITAKEGPAAALLPGSIPQAHRGILFVDEINRLADTSPELADVLLDVMGTKPGRLQIEESGLPRIELPVQVSVWAASNPDEDPGSLEDVRRQLSDRFDFLVEMGRPDSPQVVAQVLSQSGCQFERNCGSIRDIPAELQAVVQLIPGVGVSEEIREILATLYTKFSLESLRAVEALQYGSQVEAARNRLPQVNVEHLITVAPAALRHRVHPGRLGEIMAYLKGLAVHTNEQVAAAGTVPAPKPQGSVKAQTTPNQGVSGVGLWQRIREFVSQQLERLLGRGRSRAGGNGSKQGTKQARGRKGSRAGGQSDQRTGQSQVANPNNTTILAPPRKARALFELAAEGSIFTEKKGDNDAIQD